MNDNNEDVLFAHLLALAEEMLEAMAKTMRKFRAHLDSQDSRADGLEYRIALLEQSRAKRLDAIEQRLAALEEPQGHPDDVRDALAELDSMTTKLDGFPPQDNVICWPPFDPDQPDQTLFMWRVADDEDGE